MYFLWYNELANNWRDGMKNLRPRWYDNGSEQHPVLTMEGHEYLTVIMISGGGVVTRKVSKVEERYMRPLSQSTDRTLKSMRRAAKRMGCTKGASEALAQAVEILNQPTETP